MKVVTSSEIGEIDKKTIEHYGISAPILMERAGVAVAARVKEVLRESRILVLAGTGNNGGDGLVAARELHNAGYTVKVLITGKRNRLKENARLQHDIARKMRVPMEFRDKVTAGDLHGSLVLDAVFGTGLSKDIQGPLAEVIRAVNGSPARVVAVDIPSGVSSDTGQVLGAALHCAATVTFGAPKRGHFLHPGAGLSGELFVEDIGFPRALFEPIRTAVPSRRDVASLVPAREPYSHKGAYGHVLLVAGSRGKTGAAMMAAHAALRTGAGLVSIGVADSLLGIYEGRVTEEMTLPLEDTGRGSLARGALTGILEFLDERADVLALGPGIGRDRETAEMVRELLPRCAAPMVVDADGINALEGKAALLRKARAPVILTPHPGEFSRLTGMGVKEIESDRVEAALRFAKTSGAYIILKGVPTVVADPAGEALLNPTGNAALAKGGTGDVLTGMVAALLGQGLSPLEAAVLGVYAHGLAGEIAACEKDMRSVLATDVADAVPGVFGRLTEGFDDIS
ncbi:MAG: NAD(P)H-hydrate dehydratase [Nitrospirota bacterium]